MAKNKKQHYVPQFYLRPFSHDGKMVYAYNLKHKKVFPVKIKNMCQENYFYCDVKDLEQNMAIVEGKQAVVVAEVIEKLNVQSIDATDKFYLLLFILMQCTRTKKSKLFADSLIDTVFDTYCKPSLKESHVLIDKGIKPEDIDPLHFEFERSHLLMMFPAMFKVDLIRDLKMVLIINHTNHNFVTSDTPCCLYNYIKSNNYGMLGFHSPGLIIFCPLNTKVLLLLFDPELYNVNLNDKSIIHVENTSDIDAINKLQIHNCLESLICSEKDDGDYLNQLNVEIENNLKKSKIKSIKASKQYIENGYYGEIAYTYQMPMDYTLKLSFLKLNHITSKMIKSEMRKLKKSREQVTLCRNSELCEKIEDTIANAKKIIEEQIAIPINAY